MPSRMRLGSIELDGTRCHDMPRHASAFLICFFAATAALLFGFPCTLCDFLGMDLYEARVYSFLMALCSSGVVLKGCFHCTCCFLLLR